MDNDKHLNRPRTEGKPRKLEDIHSHYQRFFDLSMDLMAIASIRDGRWKRVNAAMCQALGWSEEELLGMPFMDMVHPEDRPRSEQAVADLAADRPLVKFEVRVRCKDGRCKWIVWNAIPYPREGLCYCVGQDVTDRRNTEEQLQTTLKSIGDGFFILDKDWGFTFVNDQAQRLLDMDGGDLLGRHFWDVFAPALGTLAETEYRKAAAGESRAFEYFYEPWERWYHIRAFPRDGGGISVYFQDITDRKRAEAALQESERRLHFSLEAGRIGMWDLDLVKYTAYRTIEHDRIFGYHQQLPQWTYEMFLDHVLPEDRPAVDARFQQAVATGGKWDFECRIRRVDGQIRWIRAAGSHRRDTSGKVRRMVGIVQDITERKQAEEDLRRERSRLQSILENMSEGLMLFDAEGTLIYQNPASLRIHGFSSREEERIAREVLQTIWQAWDEEGRPIRFDQWPVSRGLRGERFQNQVLHVLRPETGVEFDASYNGCPIYDSQGKLVLAFITIRDITMERQGQEALRQSEAKFRAVFEQAAIGMGRVRFDDARWIDVNDTFCRMLGYSREEMLRTPWPEITHPEDVDLDLAPFQRMAAGDLESYSVEKRFIHKEGHFVWARLTLSLVRDGQGRPDYEIAVIENISERKGAQEALQERERRFRKAFEIDTVGVLFFDMEANFLDANEAFLRMIGYNREALERGELNSSLVTIPEWMERTRAAFEELNEIGRLSPYEKQLVRPDGSQWWGLFAGTRLSENEAVEFVLDITERKRMEDALKELNESLEQRVTERTEQLRALALQLSQAEHQERKRLAKVLHDHLQQLIVAARMQIGWMKAGADVEAMQSAAGEVDGILQEAIDASRSLAVDLSPPVLHEAGLAGGLNWLASDLEKKHHFRVNLELEKQAEPAFETIRLLLFESVRELLLNAIKHSGADSAQVALLQGGNGQIRLIVSDEGRGFDPGVLRNRRSDEVSFGLFSIQERLAHIDGQMVIESAPGKGTRITLTVSDSGEVEEATSVAEAAQEQDQETVRVRHKSDLCTVLIVDDHKIMRQGLVRLFRSESDIEVVGEAADGPEAIAKADELRPDVIVMDVNLGEMSGVEATRRILQRHPEIRVVGLSMHADKEVADAMLEAGACAYRTKSGPSEELVASVRHCAPAKA